MPSAGSSRILWATYALVIAFVLLPVFLVEIPPLADLPNHLARAHILERLSSSAALQQYYAVQWRVLSFQSTDFVLPPLVHLIGIAAAAKLYIIATLLLLLAGTAALHRALFGRIGLWPAASAVFLFNFLLAWGFVAYLSAIGLVLLLFAAWIATEDRRKPIHLVLFALGTIALLLCHLFAFATYLVLIGVTELVRAFTRKAPPHRRLLDLVLAGVTLLPAALLVVMSIDPATQTLLAFGTFADIARGLVSPTIMYMDWADLTLTYAVAMAAWLLYRRRLLRFDRRMLAPLLVLFMLALVTPPTLFSVWGANLRIPCLLAFLLIAATELKITAPSSRVLAAVLLCVVAGRAIALTITWQGYARDIAEFRAADQAIAPGARVLATSFPDDYQRRREPAIFPLVHMAAFSVIDRDVFLPSLFSFATPLRFTTGNGGMIAFGPREKPVWQPHDPAFAKADAATRSAVEALAEVNALNDSALTTVDWPQWPENYDYLIDFHFGAVANPVPALLTEVASGRIFTIYRIHSPQ